MATALITGASSGIGYELAKRFAADGHNIILVARDKARLRQVAKELSLANDVDVVYIACDLTDPKCWAEVALAAREHGPVDVLVNDAGLGKHGDFAKVDLNDHLYVLHTNITALTVLTKLLLPQIVRRKGKILNLASIA
jgi:short-subunit dehydrogenase